MAPNEQWTRHGSDTRQFKSLASGCLVLSERLEARTLMSASPGVPSFLPDLGGNQYAGFGVNIKYGDLPVQPSLQTLGPAFGIVRDDMPEGLVEKSVGVYNFTNTGQSNFDQEYNNAIAQNVRPLFLLTGLTKLFNNGDGNQYYPYNAASEQAFANYAAASVNQYKNKAIKPIYELENEPNLGWATPAGFTNTSQYISDSLRLAAASMRAADPAATIIGPAMNFSESGTSSFSQGGVDLLVKLAKDGALADLDAISLHPYQGSAPETVAAKYNNLRATLQSEAGVNLPLVQSEVGYSQFTTGGIPGGEGADLGGQFRQLTTQQQAAYLVRTYMTSLYSGIDLNVWYKWNLGSDFASNNEGGLGVVGPTNWSTNTPSYRSATTMMGLLRQGYQFAGRVSTASSGDWVMKFADTSGNVALVAWTTDRIGGTGKTSSGDVHNITLPLSGSWTLKTMEGSASTITPTGSASVSVSQFPVYLVGTAANLGSQTFADRTPTAVITPSTRTPATGAAVTFDGSLSSDIDSDAITGYAWDVNGDGLIDSTNASYTYTFASGGTYNSSLTVTDARGASHTYTQVTTVSGNKLPVAVNDVIVNAQQDSALNINVLANDSDADAGTTLTIQSVAAPAHGSTSIVAGQVQYTPNAGFFGRDKFTYVISDGVGGTATATVTLDVRPTNYNLGFQWQRTVDWDRNGTANPDADSLGNGVWTYTYVSNTGQLGSTDPWYDNARTNMPASGAFWAKDNAKIDRTLLEQSGTFSNTRVPVLSWTNPTGSTRLINLSGVITATANGTASQTGNLDLAIAKVSGTTVTLLQSQTQTLATNDLQNKTFSFSNLDLNVSLAAGESILVTVRAPMFTSEVAQFNDSRLRVTIAEANVVPVAVNDAVNTPTGIATDVAVLSNDSDANAIDTLTVQSVTTPANGTVQINGSSVRYAPKTGFQGIDTFTYTASDGHGGTATATVTVTVGVSTPTAPTGLSTTSLSQSQIFLQWTDNSSNETGFKIERATNSSFTLNLTQVATTAANATGYTDSGLSAGTVYYYRVRATNAAGNSAYTNASSSTTALFSDNFSGGLSNWTTSGGTWAAQASRNGRTDVYQQNSTAAATDLAVAGQSAWANYTLSAWVNTTDTVGSMGIVGRYLDANNYYGFALSGGQWKLYKNVAGVVTVLNSGTLTYAANTWYRLKLTMSGSALTAAWSTNGTNFTTLGTATDATFATGRIALRTSSVAGAFDDVLVT